MPIIPATENSGAVSCTRGARSAAWIEAPDETICTPITTAATRNASGAAQRGRNRSASSQATTTGATASGFSAMPVMGPRQSWNSTPASMACATETGMRATSAPSCGMSPVATMRMPVMRKAPTATGQPPSTVPVAASSAAPGVDQATVIGRRVQVARMMQPRPMVTLTARSPLDAWSGLAPTALRPVSTTMNELVNATSAETTPAEIGRRMLSRGEVLLAIRVLVSSARASRDLQFSVEPGRRAGETARAAAEANRQTAQLRRASAAPSRPARGQSGSHSRTQAQRYSTRRAASSRRASTPRTRRSSRCPGTSP